MKRLLLVLPIVLACVLSACGNGASRPLQGYVEGEYVYVSAPVAGTLARLDVERGAQVAAGAPLFALDDTPLRAQRDAAQARLMQAQAAVKDAQKGLRPTELDALQAQYQQAVAARTLAEKELVRQTKIFDAVGGTSKQDVDRARAARDQASEQVAALGAQLKTAKLGARNDQVSAARANTDAMTAQLNQAQWELDQAAQRAPDAGAIADVLYRPGEFVAAGHPIVVLLPPANVKVRTFVPEKELAAVHVGDAVQVTVDGAAHPLAGKVSFIAPSAEFTPPVVYSQSERAKFVTLVEVQFDPAVAATLHPGQPVDVLFGHARSS